ncbi:MAG: response regulator [Firmicutes bacterium]|nr:response regulator [Bacillota bacterium]
MKKKILLLEDNAKTLVQTTQILTENGYDVEPCYNIFDARCNWDDFHSEIDIIITDLQVPMMGLRKNLWIETHSGLFSGIVWLAKYIYNSKEIEEDNNEEESKVNNNKVDNNKVDNNKVGKNKVDNNEEDSKVINNEEADAKSDYHDILNNTIIFSEFIGQLTEKKAKLLKSVKNVYNIIEKNDNFVSKGEGQVAYGVLLKKVKKIDRKIEKAKKKSKRKFW